MWGLGKRKHWGMQKAVAAQWRQTSQCFILDCSTKAVNFALHQISLRWWHTGGWQALMCWPAGSSLLPSGMWHFAVWYKPRPTDVSVAFFFPASWVLKTPRTKLYIFTNVKYGAKFYNDVWVITFTCLIAFTGLITFWSNYFYCSNYFYWSNCFYWSNYFLV